MHTLPWDCLEIFHLLQEMIEQIDSIYKKDKIGQGYGGGKKCKPLYYKYNGKKNHFERAKFI